MAPSSPGVVSAMSRLSRCLAPTATIALCSVIVLRWRGWAVTSLVSPCVSSLLLLCHPWPGSPVSFSLAVLEACSRSYGAVHYYYWASGCISCYTLAHERSLERFSLHARPCWRIWFAIYLAFSPRSRSNPAGCYCRWVVWRWQESLEVQIGQPRTRRINLWRCLRTSTWDL